MDDLRPPRNPESSTFDRSAMLDGDGSHVWRCLLDENNCGPCKQRDGLATETAGIPPLRACESDLPCRCTVEDVR